MIDRALRFGIVPIGSRWVILVSVAHVIAFTAAPGPVTQLPLALMFYLTCPGALLVDWIGLSDFASRVTLVVSSSLAVNTLALIPLLAIDLYSPSNGLLLVVVVSLGATVISARITADRSFSYSIGALPEFPQPRRPLRTQPATAQMPDQTRVHYLFPEVAGDESQDGGTTPPPESNR